MIHKYPDSILLPEPISKIKHWITTFILSNGASLEMSGTTWIISFQEPEEIKCALETMRFKAFLFDYK
ncbi:unnamed protein product [Rhodiola kirilowii]